MEQVEEIFAAFNSSRMQFMIELEVDGQPKFLNTILRKQNGTISTEWTSKDPDNRYLDFKSVSAFCH